MTEEPRTLLKQNSTASTTSKHSLNSLNSEQTESVYSDDTQSGFNLSL